MSTVQPPPRPPRSAQKRLLVAVVAQAESDRLALSTAFADHPIQRIAFSSTLDTATSLIEHQAVDAIIGFVDDPADWPRFQALAKRHPRAMTVLLVSDPDQFDARADGRVLNAVVGTSREDLARRAAAATAHVATQHGPAGTPVAQANALDRERLESLSQREREILELTARGLAIKEIAARINRSYSTVATHRVKIMEKLGLHDKVALTRFAIRTGLIGA